jgi:hypothetical protein
MKANISNLAKNKEKSFSSTNKEEIHNSLRDQFNVTDFSISNSFQSSQNILPSANSI